MTKQWIFWLFWQRAIDYFSLRSNQQIKLHYKNENIQIKEDKDEVSKNSERKGKKWKSRQGVSGGG